MTTYAVLSKATGLEVYRYNADAPTELQGMTFDLTDHVAQPDPDVAPVVPAQIEWTKVEFLRRFTAAERIAVREVAKTNPLIDDFMQLMSEAPSIRNDDPDVIAGLGYLEMLTVLAAGRAAEILGGQ